MLTTFHRLTRAQTFQEYNHATQLLPRLKLHPYYKTPQQGRKWHQTEVRLLLKVGLLFSSFFLYGFHRSYMHVNRDQCRVHVLLEKMQWLLSKWNILENFFFLEFFHFRVKWIHSVTIKKKYSHWMVKFLYRYVRSQLRIFDSYLFLSSYSDMVPQSNKVNAVFEFPPLSKWSNILLYILDLWLTLHFQV